MKKTLFLFIALILLIGPVNAQYLKSGGQPVKNQHIDPAQLKARHSAATSVTLPGTKKEFSLPKTISWQWDTIVCYDTLGLANRYIQTLDNIGNPLTRVCQSRSGGIWVNSSKYTYTYDADGNKLTELNQTWNSGNWVNVARDTYTYNSAGFILTEWHENWQGSAWENAYRKTWTYNLNGNILTGINENWQGGAWVYVDRSTYTYDINGNMLENLYETWQVSAWQNGSRYTWTYDTNDNKLTELVEFWTAGAWENSYRKTWTYDVNGYMLTEFMESWQGGVWENSSLFTYTNDINGSILDLLSEMWNGSAWENYERYFFTWDLSGKMLTSIWEYWDLGAWVTDSKDTYTYDVSGNMLTHLFQSWYLGWNNNTRYTYTYNAGGNLLSVLWEVWDSGICYNFDRYTYTYDANGNSITGQYDIWENNSWQPGSNLLDVYAGNTIIHRLDYFYRYEASFSSNNSCSAYYYLYPDSITPHLYYAVNMAQGAPPLSYLWDWGDGTTDNIPYPSHTYSTAGFYTICLTVSDTTGCTNTYCDTSTLTKNTNTIIQVNVISPSAGLIENDPNDALTVYPNPALDNITIEGLPSTIKGIPAVYIYNIQGQMLLQQALQQQKTAINISGLAKGMYIVKVFGPEINVVKRIIKE